MTRKKSAPQGASPSAARPLQPAVENLKKSPLRLGRGKDHAVIPPVEFIHKMTVATSARTCEIFQITAMDMQKKYRKRDKVYGMPLYFSMAAGEHKVYLYPVPSVNIDAQIEYKPL